MHPDEECQRKRHAHKGVGGIIQLLKNLTEENGQRKEEDIFIRVSYRHILRTLVFRVRVFWHMYHGRLETVTMCIIDLCKGSVNVS